VAGFLTLHRKLNVMNTNVVQPDEMSTLSERVNSAVQEGYTENFQVETKGLTGAGKEDKKYYKAEDVKIINFYRFEGASDPQDSSILYLIETNDGRKGTLVDAYGMYAETKVSDFIKLVEDFQKKSPHTQN
jgi:hypothetical protein